MMDVEKLIERLQNAAGGPEGIKMCNDAATALSTLYEENAEMQKQLNEFSVFLCHMTGGFLSKTNYTAEQMISEAEDYQQRVCDSECDLKAENEKLRYELGQVKRERDAGVCRVFPN